ncbi:unnamed protein product [Ectocarpus sp. CCAP 1310/34]|nr:unnamed protein product [Ectocarpus sp. CCAP 1310/34]
MGFDGGDCCECTCEDGEYTCGQYVGYACIDPGAACVDDDAVTVDMMENCYDASRIGNGACDSLLNNEECAYDGGDCCECTCDPSRYPWYDSGEGCQTGMYGGFACIDPDAPCVDDDIVTVEMMDLCYTGQIGNGYCDDVNNSPECGMICDAPRVKFICTVFRLQKRDRTFSMLLYSCAYDGGDCCECTCESHDDGYEYYCKPGSFACIDPGAECVDDDDNTAEQYEHCGWVTRIGDGMCDDENNKEECGKGVPRFPKWRAPCDVVDESITAGILRLVTSTGFDGGDCCECTCVVSASGGSPYACQEIYNINSFDCLDTSASCYGDEDLTPGDGSMSYELSFVWDDYE